MENGGTHYTAVDLKELEETMSEKLRSHISPSSNKCCIFRVPELLRRHNRGAFGPDIISIGPFHSQDEKLQPMENVKQWYLHNLLLRMEIDLETLIQRLVKFLEHKKEETISNFERRARDFYAEPIHLKENQFIEMMILDGCFLIELFRNSFHEKGRKNNDPIFNIDCMFQYVCHDLLLLENQLPWFVLSRLYSLTQNPDGEDISLSALMLTVFTQLSPLRHNCMSYKLHLLEGSDDDEEDVDEKILHILDLIRTSIVFPFKVFVPPNRKIYKKCFHRIVEKLRKCLFESEEKSEGDSEIPSATALSKAGIQFEKCHPNSDSIMKIEFEDGVLKIPQLEVGELTESLFRNLIAFEQCYHGHSHHITSYAILMDKLLASSKDMEFLCEKDIIANWLSTEDGSKFFNKLYNDTLVKEFYYRPLCIEVNRYYKNKWNEWLETFKREHLSNPWKVTALLAAFILLVLTLLQTAYTLQQYYFPPQ